MHSGKIYIPKISDQVGVELQRMGLEIQDAAIAVARTLESVLIEHIEILRQHGLLEKGSNDSLKQNIKVNRRSSQSSPYYRQYEKKHGSVGKRQ